MPSHMPLLFIPSQYLYHINCGVVHCAIKACWSFCAYKDLTKAVLQLCGQVDLLKIGYA